VSASLQPVVNFWELRHPSPTVAIVDSHSGRSWTYGQLRQDAERLATLLAQGGHKTLCALRARNRYECLVFYLAALRSGQALLLIDAALTRELWRHLIEIYQPHFIADASLDVALSDYECTDKLILPLWQRRSPATAVAIHSALALLLSTSGSTGSPKMARLTLNNLQSNAQAIAQYLTLSADDKPIAALPMAYSYGLSVINSHLLVGATLVLSEYGVLRREFWDGVEQHGCTSFSAVPYTYQMLLQTGLLAKRGATLRTLTQAGGRLPESQVRQLYELARSRNGRFFVMYGQTEATARIAFVPWSALGSKPGAIGIAIPGGTIRLDPGGELIYSGPNVMLGYAECRQDLCRGDELHGVLHTGDLARQDADGFFYITGRTRRFLKLFGKRFNLDELEEQLTAHLAAASACLGRDDMLVVATEHADTQAATAFLRDTHGLPRDVVRVIAMDRLPRTLSGKVDYPALALAQPARLAIAGSP